MVTAPTRLVAAWYVDIALKSTCFSVLLAVFSHQGYSKCCQSADQVLPVGAGWTSLRIQRGTQTQHRHCFRSQTCDSGITRGARLSLYSRKGVLCHRGFLSGSRNSFAWSRCSWTQQHHLLLPPTTSQRLVGPGRVTPPCFARAFACTGVIPTPCETLQG